MIAIIGDSEDSILYFKARVEFKEKVKLLGDYEVYVGTLGSETIAIVASKPSNYSSLILTNAIINKFEPYLILNIGECTSLKDSLRQGDVFVADRHYIHGVDFGQDGKSRYGQIPGLPAFFSTNTSINNQVESAAYEIGTNYIERGFMLSGEKLIFEKAQFNDMILKHYAGSYMVSAYDNMSAGVAIACQASEVALLTIKIVGLEPSNEEQRFNHRRKALENMPLIGSILSKILLDSEPQ